MNSQLDTDANHDHLELWPAYKQTVLENEFLKNRVRDLYQQVHDLDQNLRSLKKQEGRDESTGLPDLNFFQNCLDREFDRARRYCHFFSVILLHVSLGLNDATVNYDREIRQLKHAFENMRRKSDVIARYQKKQIVLLLPETEESGAQNLAQRLLNAVNPKNGALRYSILTYPTTASKSEDLLEAIRETSKEFHRRKY